MISLLLSSPVSSCHILPSLEIPGVSPYPSGLEKQGLVAGHLQAKTAGSSPYSGAQHWQAPLKYTISIQPPQEESWLVFINNGNLVALASDWTGGDPMALLWRLAIWGHLYNIWLFRLKETNWRAWPFTQFPPHFQAWKTDMILVVIFS